MGEVTTLPGAISPEELDKVAETATAQLREYINHIAEEGVVGFAVCQDLACHEVSQCQSEP